MIQQHTSRYQATVKAKNTIIIFSESKIIFNFYWEVGIKVLASGWRGVLENFSDYIFCPEKTVVI